MWGSNYWIDPLRPLLDGWSVEQASQAYHPNVASVLAMINHTAFWEDFGLRLLRGESIDEMQPIEDAAYGKYPDWMPSWPQAVDNYSRIRNEICDALAQINDEELLAQPAEDSIDLESRIFTRSIHASYHAGQINNLRRLYGMPESTGGAAIADSFPAVSGIRNLLINMLDSAWSSGFSINPFEQLTEDINDEDANLHFEELSSIKEIVNHMHYWEEYVTRRMLGQDTDDMPRVDAGSSPPGMPEWPEARMKLITQHDQLRESVEILSDEELSQARPGIHKKIEEGKSAQWLIYGVVEHHAYHVGQIVLLRQLMGHEEYII
jgi:uncharacterized damage-inducible protein DinB